MEQLKVMLVDDEALIRSLLRLRVDWKALGMEIIAEAGDAREAFDAIERQTPDIILTDICMPSMDGIAFSQMVVEQHPQVRIVILTGHDEFDYAKRSVKIGVSDFLLKPVNAAEITRVMQGLKTRILSERVQLREQERLMAHLEAVRPAMREKSLNALVSGASGVREAVAQLAYLGVALHPEHEHFEVALVETMRLRDAGESDSERDLLLALQVRELARQVFRQDAHVHVFLDDCRRIVLMANEPGLDLPGCCEVLRNQILNQCRCDVTIGVGGLVQGVEHIRESWQQARQALSYRAIAGRNQVIVHSEVDLTDAGDRIERADRLDELAFALGAGMSQRVRELVDAALDTAACRHHGDLSALRLEAFDLVLLCQRVRMEQRIGQAAGEGDGRLEDAALRRILEIADLPGMKAHIHELFQATSESVSQAKQCRANRLVEQIREHIMDNLSDPELSRGTTAAALFISPSHLSRVFRQATGMNYVEYVTKARMEKAMRLLRESDLRMYQIGEAVGIVDPHYFSILFKKHAGMSPNEYRSGAGASTSTDPAAGTVTGTGADPAAGAGPSASKPVTT